MGPKLRLINEMWDLSLMTEREPEDWGAGLQLCGQVHIISRVTLVVHGPGPPGSPVRSLTGLRCPPAGVHPAEPGPGGTHLQDK